MKYKSQRSESVGEQPGSMDSGGQDSGKEGSHREVGAPPCATSPPRAPARAQEDMAQEVEKPSPPGEESHCEGKGDTGDVH